MTEAGLVFSINCSPGGVPKLPVPEALVSPFGVFGDSQKNRRYHGGPDRAVCLFSLERIRALQDEGHPIGTGTTGENLTISGLDWDLVVPGSILEIGDAVLEITDYTKPCRTIRESFTDEKFTRMSQKLHPGWSRVYARVLKEGLIKTGDQVKLNPAGLPQKGWLQTLLS
ncbi:MAG TPA: MOSC domain-containing protein [Gemmatimonadaceae bacterium]